SRCASCLECKPPFDDAEHVIELLFGQGVAALDLVRLLQASAAAGGRRVLGHEDRMVAPRRLPPVIARLGGSDALRDEIPPLLEHVRQSPSLQISQLPPLQAKLAAKGRRGKPAKGLIERE